VSIFLAFSLTIVSTVLNITPLNRLTWKRCISSRVACYGLPNSKTLGNLEAYVDCSVANCVPLLIQQNINRFNRSYFFNRSWAEFKVGFNDSDGNYWLGNDLLSQLTVSSRYKVRFYLQSHSNTSNWYNAEYSTFRVLPETDNYRLEVFGYSGNAGQDALSYHDGLMFSTYDRDNDRHSTYNCAALYGGGFWYNNCAHGCGFYWAGLPGGRNLQSSRMWLQCK